VEIETKGLEAVDLPSARNLDIDGRAGFELLLLCECSERPFVLHIDVSVCKGIRSGVDIKVDLMVTLGVVGLLEIGGPGSVFSSRVLISTLR
jgi:hypothetical protein